MKRSSGGGPPWEEEESPKTLSTADISKVHHALEPALEKRALKFLGWEKVLHQSQTVVAAGEIPQPSKTSRPKVGSSQLSWMIPIKPPASPLKTPTPPKPSLPVQALALMQPPSPPHGFSGVMACLWMPELVEVDLPHWTGSDSWDFHYEYELHCKGRGYRHNIHGHHHYLCWEGAP